MECWLAFIVTALLVVTCKSDIIDYVKGSIIDLTHPFDNTTLFYNGKREFNLTTLLKLQAEKYWVNMNSFSSVEHGGTHIDAPSHFVKGGDTVGDVPLSRLIGPAVVIRASDQALVDPNYQVTIADITQWESKNGRIPDRAIILLDFHWSEKWPDMVKFFGTTDPSNGSSKSFPGLHPETAEWLVTQRPEINAVATETPSIDHGPTQHYISHTTLLKHNICILENVANADTVPDFATIFAIPMKIQSGTGAPLRIFAVITNVDIDSWFSANIYVISILCTLGMLFVFNYRRQR